VPAAGLTERIKSIFTFERIFVLILILAFVLRFAFLDLKLFHHDEAIHGWFSYDLLTKGAWSYDPSYHGPFLYFVTAGMFAVFGASDLVGRILPAFFGFLLIPLAWCVYRLGYLDRTQTLIAALLIAISPDMVYFSRFLRHDIFMLAFTFMLVVAILAYFERKQTRYAILGAIATAGALCCKEEMPIILIIIASFFIISIWRKRFVLPHQWKTDLALCIVLIAAIMAVLYTGFGGHPDTLTGQNFNITTSGWYEAIEHWSAMHNEQRLGGPWFYYIPLYLLYELPIFILAMIALVQFLVPFSQLAIARKKMANWIRNRTFSLTTEDLASISIRQIATGTRVVPDKRDEFIRFCIWWMLLTMAFYAWVGEKVPWLIIPQLLPMIFVATYRLTRWKVGFALIGTIFLIVVTWHVAFVPADINEPIVQVQNSEDLRVVMDLMDHADGIVLASENYWPLPWYYRGDRWNRITFYGKKIELPDLVSTNPDMIILHDTDSYDTIDGYTKTTYKLCYWFSYYDNEDRLLDYYIHRDGKMGSINIDVFIKNNSTLASLSKTLKPVPPSYL